MKLIEDLTRVDDEPCVQFRQQNHSNLSTVLITNGTRCASTVSTNTLLKNAFENDIFKDRTKFGSQ